MTRYTRYRKTFNKTTINQEKRQLELDNSNGSAKRKVCLNCRKPGHRVQNCPETGDHKSICYNCGSSEHGLKECTAPSSNFAHATCFVCKEKGHLAGQCPKNERGVYPNGGSCRFCGSTKHLARNCNPTTNDPREVVVAAIPRDQVKKANPEDDFVHEALQKMTHKGKRTPQQSKTKTRAKVVKF